MGTEIKGYSILGKIAKGGMGEVYKAIHSSLNKEVILKKLSSKSPATFFERFKREASLMMDISHPNIVHMFDYFMDEGSSYIVMEYVSGYNLSELLKRYEKLPLYIACYIILQIAKGLEYAHQKDIIHRDIKPANILISSNGEAKLTDFGIAFKYELNRSDGMTKQGTILGTPAYMSPEQIESSKDVDVRADIYSLGVIFYEILTGVRPFSNDLTINNLRKINKGKYTDIRKLNKNVPEKIVNIIKKMMHYDKSKRYKSCKKIILELENFIFLKFQDERIIKSGLANLVNEKQINLDTYKYSNIYFIIDFAKKIFFSSIFIGLFFLFIYLFIPDFYLNFFLKDNYGIVNIDFDNSFYKTPINFDIISDNGKIYKNFFYKKESIFLNNMILKSGKYYIKCNYANQIFCYDFYVYSYRIKKRNNFKFRIGEIQNDIVDIKINVLDETGNQIEKYKIFYKISGAEKWNEYSESEKLYSANMYDFYVVANNYIYSIYKNIYINSWEKYLTLNFRLSSKKAVIKINIKEPDLDISIDNNKIVFTNEYFTNTRLIDKKVSNYIFYLDKGNYKLYVYNKKKNVKIESILSIKTIKEYKLDIFKDRENYVVVDFK